VALYLDFGDEGSMSAADFAKEESERIEADISRLIDIGA
jgi:hypothetical protein